jgi:DNA-binding CsgD family transcriptional regulator
VNEIGLPPTMLEGHRHPVLVVDDRGRVRYMNQSASKLLGQDRSSVRGRRCWQVARMQTPEGGPFCSADCPIWREARSGELQPNHQVSRVGANGAREPLYLLTLPLSPPNGKRAAVLHIFVPRDRAREEPDPTRVPDCPVAGVEEAAAALGAENAASTEGESVAEEAEPLAPEEIVALQSLSLRETEILEELAAGHRTREIAERLGISPTTVRNHVRKVLKKLGVHRRLEAVLLWLRSPR